LPNFLDKTRATLKTTRPVILLLFRVYRGNVSTEPLNTNDKGIFTEPLPSNDREIFTEPLLNNDKGEGDTHTHTQSNVIS
jgi:hypothetical protein